MLLLAVVGVGGWIPMVVVVFGVGVMGSMMVVV